MHKAAHAGPKPGQGRLLWALMALIALVYLRGLTGEFVWDDRLFFVDNDILPSWGWSGLYKSFIMPSTHWDDYIPVTNLLFTVEYNLFGRFTIGYHMVSLTLYLLSGALLFRLVKRIYGLALGGERFIVEPRGQWGAESSAIIVTAFFMLHPVHVEVVSYITGQKDLLYGLFTLLSLYGLTVYCSHSRGQGGRGWLALVVVAYYIAFMSKTMAAANAVFIPLFWLMILRRRGEGLLRPAVFWALANLVAFGALFYKMPKLLGNVAGMWDRWLMGIKVLGAHLGVFALPWPLNFGYPFNETSTLDPNMLIGLLFIIGSAVFVIGRPRSLTSLGIVIFLSFLLPVLQVFIRISNAVVFDRYLYISVLGGAVFFERALAWLSPRIGRRAVMAGALCVILLYSSLTLMYVPMFRSDVASLRHAYTTFPGWKRPAFDYVYALIEAGELEEARRLAGVERTFEHPDWVRPYFLGWIHVERGQASEALSPLILGSYSANSGGYFPYPDVPLARAYMALGKEQDARAAIRRVMAQRLRNPLEYYKAKVLLHEMDNR